MNNQQRNNEQVVMYTLDLFRQMQSDVEGLKKSREVVPQAKLSAQTYGLAQADYAHLPAGSKGAMVFVTDGRKPSELTSQGTGVHAYYNDVTATWLSFYDDLAVTI